MVKASSITSLILGSIALVQCIPLEVRDPSPFDFESCYHDGLTDSNDFIAVAKSCLQDASGITCSETPSGIEENEKFDNCLFVTNLDIEDIAERVQACIKEFPGVTCTDPSQ